MSPRRVGTPFVPTRILSAWSPPSPASGQELDRINRIFEDVQDLY